MASCAWDLYVREGVVWREEQAAPYTASNASVPDWNPRGCQKGAGCSDLMIGPLRLLHPLRRVGARGSGRWKRIGWDEALAEIAVATVDVLARRGGEGVLCELGTNLDYGPGLAGTLRFFRQIGALIPDVMAQEGDLCVGATITLGSAYTDGSSDDWFRSDYLVLWSVNAAVTRIPDAHYMNEARYRGGRVVTIAPDYSQSAIHADLWLSPRPGTDAALALAACRVVLEENLYQADYIREQTDLPLLVHADSRRFLRESEVVRGGRDDCFACWDEAKQALVWAPGTAGHSKRSLEFPEGVRPDLDARAEVRLASGEIVAVRTVFSLLRQRLERFDLEEASRITGIAPGVIRRFARDFAGARSALIVTGYRLTKGYHSDLVHRSQILLASLTGTIGRAGAGWRSCSFIDLEGIGLVAGQDRLSILDLILLGVRSKINPEAVLKEFSSIHVSGTLFHAVHGGLLESQTAGAYADPALPRSPISYLKEALAKGHFPVGPPPGAEPPEVVVSVFGNVLRSSRMGQRVRDTIFAKARLVVDVTLRMSETARHADILLPAAGWYEKLSIKYTMSYLPYLTLGDRAVAPLGQSKSEWKIFSRLAERIAQEARRQSIAEIRGFRGQPCDIARLDERFSDQGRFGPEEEEQVLRFILRTSQACQDITLEDLRREGAIRLGTLGRGSQLQGIHSEYRPDEPVVPMRDFVEKKLPYPTLTGRQQFYVDHPWFLELGEELPTHKEPPLAGGDHPFTLTGGHARWSVHAIWRDNPMMLRLQRGEPVVYVNDEIARERGIADHDLVHVWNDVGEFVARAKLAGGVHPRQVHIFHAWEPFQFRTGTSHQSLTPSPIKVTQLVGDYGHLRWKPSHYDPNQVDCDTRVDLRKL
jgi:DMSO reductase family type II enzyme molybdopterin subunit